MLPEVSRVRLETDVDQTQVKLNKMASELAKGLENYGFAGTLQLHLMVGVNNDDLGVVNEMLVERKTALKFRRS